MHRFSLLALPLALLAAWATAAALNDRALELRSLGIAQLENERPADAEATFRQLIAKLPDDPLGHANLAIALLRQQDNDAAFAAIDRALELAPGRADLLAIRAEIEVWSGRSEDAVATYLAAAGAAPDDLEIVYGLFRHASTLRTEEAESAADQAIRQLARLRPDNLLVTLRLGSQAIARGDRQTASEAFLRVRELIWQAPPIAEKTLGTVLDALEAGDLEAARVPALRLENVLKISPMYQQGQRELTTGIQGVPVERFRDEPLPTAFGKGVAVRFAASALAEGASRDVVSGDFDGDDRPDLARLTSDGVELLLAASGWQPSPVLAAPAGSSRLATFDLDNDGHLDLVAYGGARLALWRGAGDGTLADATAALGLAEAGRSTGGVAALGAFDFDIEGDLDLVTAGRGGVELWRNSLAGPLDRIGDRALPDGAERPATALETTDLDRDGDLDLLLAGADGLGWLDNLRQGSFSDRTAGGGLGGAGRVDAALSADFDNDGRFELVTAGERLELWRRAGDRFSRAPLAVSPPPAASDGGLGISRLVAFDADNDGRLDLATAGTGGLRIYLQRSGRFEAAAVEGAPDGVAGLAAADLDADGDLDLAVATAGGLVRLDNRGGNANGWVSVRLRGLDKGNGKNNLLGRGSTLEAIAGRAYQLREMDGDVAHLGLGSVGKADLLRVVWTNGVPQNRIGVTGGQRIVEEQVLKGSCPFLYTWNGERIEMVTDLLWGSPAGLPVAPGVWAAADPQELVAVPSAQPDAGRYRMLVTEELWEAAFFDLVRLWVVDHPAEVEVASSLKVVPGGAPLPDAVLGARQVRPVAAAWDGQGREVTARVATRDEVYADGYRRDGVAPSPYQGVSPVWSFTFDLGEAPARPVRLLLDGWIFPADASLNLAVAQRADLPFVAPRLEVETAGGWRTIVESMGHPAGKTKRMVVDTPPLPEGARRLRIVTSLWLHWDRIAWTTRPDDEAPRVVARLAPESAELRYRGFSRLVRRAPNAPHLYDYARVEHRRPWLPFPGDYTRYGDVAELLAAADDRSVILAAGDEMEILFDASALPPPAPGFHRTVFLESHGWDKDADRNTYEAAQVEPLPFRAMERYGDDFPQTPELLDYRRRWLTRTVAAPANGIQ